MGIFMSKCRADRYETPVQLKARIQTLEEQITSLNLQRERERKENTDEVEKLRRKIEGDEGRIRRLEGELMVSRGVECEEWQHWLGTECCLMEHMKEEQKRREVQVEKWKSLYLTIKNELDDLILRTKQGGRFILGANEDLIDRLQMEVMAKEETIEMLRSRILLIEKEEKRREREIDILRQSLRILNNTKRNGMRRKQQSRWLL